MKVEQLASFLDEKAKLYNQPSFITSDPIQIPHLFERKEDIEIIGFLVATIAWGNRKSIITNGKRLIEIMGNSPYDFILNYSEEKRSTFENFVHRTFNSTDLHYFFTALQHLYKKHQGIETVFAKYASKTSTQPAITAFKELFFELPHPERTRKHISDPEKNSAAKRINMFLRWMVRNDQTGVDFGIWKHLAPSQLSCPLDVHSGNVARKLGLLNRKQNDSKALIILDTALRRLDHKDPVRYDFALFGLGVFEKF